MRKIFWLSVLVLSLESCKKNATELDESKEAIITGAVEVVDSTAAYAASQKEKAELTTCSICGREFRGNGYEEVEEGVWEPCKDPYQCQICSKSCGMKHTQNSSELVDGNMSNLNCSFESGSDVLTYLIGKTFKEKNGNTQIRFNESGANLSGIKEYMWLSYEALGSTKGIVKLSSLNNPDGVLTLWVSCRENAVTDGNMVLLYN